MNGIAQTISQHHSVYNLRDSEGKVTLPKPSTNKFEMKLLQWGYVME